MGFGRFVEIGRVALVNYGPDNGKLCVVIDVADKNKVLVDGPLSGVRRQLIPMKRISLTDIKIRIPRQAREATIKKAWNAEQVTENWEKSSWSKKLSSKIKRAEMNDFERFQVMVARKQKSRIIRKKVAELKKKQ